MLMIAIGVALGSAHGGGDGPPPVVESPGVGSLTDLFGERRDGDDVMPDVRTAGGDFGEVNVDVNSSLLVARTARHRLWITRASSTATSEWASNFNPRSVCLHVTDRRGRHNAFQCATDGPRGGRILTVMSGGAAGAPGFRRREVLIAGVVPRGVGVRLDTVPASPASRRRGGGFIFLTQRRVVALELDWPGQGIESIPLRACQNC